VESLVAIFLFFAVKKRRIFTPRNQSSKALDRGVNWLPWRWFLRKL